MKDINGNNPGSRLPEDPDTIIQPMALDDEQRVKVLSPGMLVFKRFITNRLAIVGTITIAIMFMFSFVGGWLMPYAEDEVFKEYVDMVKDYAAVTENTEFRYAEADGRSFPSAARASFMLALKGGETSFASQNRQYSYQQLGDDFYIIFDLLEVASAGSVKNGYVVTLAESFQAPTGFNDAFKQAITDQSPTFTAGGIEYTIIQDKKFYTAYIRENLATAGLDVFDFNSSDTLANFDFQYQAQLAVLNGEKTFSLAGQSFEIKTEDAITIVTLVSGSERTEYATISRYLFKSEFADVFLSIEFKDAVKMAIAENKSSFTFTDDSGDQNFFIERNNTVWTIRKSAVTQVTQDYAQPTIEHPLGTDGNGMDILTRLMYGGRISLMIGFIVVIIETLLGVIIGGFAGYFGKWIDNLLMRLVDVFNSIPSTPLIIILGAMMDSLRIDPQVRMIYLMLILGFLGWPYIARLVRGQILSLREQEFMVAAEATGLSVYRKIFRHLVPNVIPQLIVVSTMSLGGVILTESVLSFLGLGVKYPFASWGNIINAVSNVYVMTNYWFVWIPAGFCILVTVLGFNFIGDGLRDAFDPKMKR